MPPRYTGTDRTCTMGTAGTHDPGGNFCRFPRGRRIIRPLNAHRPTRVHHRKWPIDSQHSAGYTPRMDATALRRLITDRMAETGMTTLAASRAAGLSESTVRLYLTSPDPDADTTAAKWFRLASAVGLAVTVKPVKGFSPPASKRPGRPKKPSQNSADRD